MPDLTRAPIGLSVIWPISGGGGQWVTPALFVLSDDGAFDVVIVHEGRLCRASHVLPESHQVQVDMGLFLIEPDLGHDYDDLAAPLPASTDTEVRLDA